MSSGLDEGVEGGSYFDESGQTEQDGSGGVSQLSFIGLCVVQFLTALNDNMFRWFIVKLGQDVIGETAALALGGVVFIVPYLLFAPLAGFLADRYAKRRIIVACKFAEIVLMILSLVAIQTNQIYLLLAMLFLMGTQSALFSPAKMGAIPEMLAFKNLSTGNGIFAMVTLMGTALGFFTGYLLYDMTFPGGMFTSVWIATFSLVGVAIVGWIASLAVRTKGAGNPERRFSLNPLKEMLPSLKLLFSNRWLSRAAFGIGMFYFIAISVQVNLDKVGEDVLQLKQKVQIGGLMVFLTLGIGVGGILAGRWSAGRIQVGMTPFGAFGIMVCSFILAWLTQSGGIGDATIYHILFWLFVLGISAGIFYIPLEAYLQHASPAEDRGSILAASNALTNLLMLVSLGMFFVLTDKSMLSWTPAPVFVANGIVSLFLMIAAVVFVPLAVFRFMMWFWCTTFYRIEMHGLENVRQDEGVLFTPNHTSWIDGVMMCAMLPRHARFLIYADHTERNKWLSWLSRTFEVIPIKAGAGPRAVLGALKEAENALKNGEWVCVFPEGQLTRTGKLQSFQRGAMRIVSKTKSKVVPVYMEGLWGSVFSYRGKLLWRLPNSWRMKVNIWFGEPVTNIKEASALQQEVIKLGAKAMDSQSDDLLIPARQFIRESKRSKRRMKIADSSQAELTGGKLLASTIAFARVLRRVVLSKDEGSVGIFLPPSAGGVLANSALAVLGKTSVNLNYTLSEEVVDYCVQQADIKHVLTSKRFLEKRPFDIKGAELVYLEDLKEQISLVDKVVGGLLAYCAPAWLVERLYGLQKIDPESVMTVIFTSGSTGEPKGVMLSHHNIASNTDAVDQLYNLTDDDTLVGVLPFFHSFGYTISLWVVLSCKPRGVYHFNPLDGRQVGKLSGKYGGSILLSTPTFLKAYLKRCTPEQFAKMRLIVAGAEKMPIELSEKFEEKFGVMPIEGYGATETSPLACANGLGFTSADGSFTQVDNKLGSVGQPINGVIVKAIDADSGEDLPVGEEGLLMIKGPNIMLGYLKQPEKTAEVIRDGWYDSGDFGKVDEDGFVFITGRQSRFSKIGGEMVPHIRIEEELVRIVESKQGDTEVESKDGEAEVIPLTVTAVPDAKKGERLIVLYQSGGLPCGVEELLQELSDAGLPNLWLPSRESFYEVEGIPLLGTGKLDLKGIKQMALELV